MTLGTLQNNLFYHKTVDDFESIMKVVIATIYSFFKGFNNDLVYYLLACKTFVNRPNAPERKILQ